MFKTDYLFDKEITNLKQVGVSITDLTGAEIVALVKAVDKLRNPFTGVNLDVVGMPITVGNVTLWKLTVGATVWLAEFAKVWWLDKGKEKSYFWALVYACVNARRRGAFDFLTEEKKAASEIKRLALSLAVYEQELVEAVNKCLAVRESKAPRADGKSTTPDDAPEIQTDWASIIARLEGQSGIPADEWCWNRSADYVLRVHEDLQRFAKAAAGDKVPSMRDEADMATSALAKLRVAIKANVEERKAEAEVTAK